MPHSVIAPSHVEHENTCPLADQNSTRISSNTNKNTQNLWLIQDSGFLSVIQEQTVLEVVLVGPQEMNRPLLYLQVSSEGIQ